MLDIRFIRENKDLITAAATKKHIDFSVDELLTVDDKRRELLATLEKKRASQNAMSQTIAQVTDPAVRDTHIKEMKELKDSMTADEDVYKETLKTWQGLMLRVPNIPDMSVPEGASDADNKEVRTWGTAPAFPFTPKDHIALMEALDMVDFERGVKVAGFRGHILKGAGAMLSMAVWQYALATLSKKGFTPMVVPSMVKRELLIGSGYLPQGEEDLYKTQDSSYLAGTAEVSMMGYYSDEVIDVTQPKKFVAFSPCFRREAGSHSKDTKGLIRVHEFYKIEQIVLAEASHELSVKLHEEITANAEEMMQALGLPYRVVVNCAGDLGLGQVKKYDIEAWVPSQNTYRETHSASYFHDFQTRRLNIRYRDAEGKLKFAHSLNNTAFATPRLLVAIVENYQQADGSIVVPEVLRPYMGGLEVIQK